VFLNKHVFIRHKKFKFLVSQASIAETGVVFTSLLDESSKEQAGASNCVTHSF
jgi:hypothetical protein